jgi:hypothetical protein
MIYAVSLSSIRSDRQIKTASMDIKTSILSLCPMVVIVADLLRSTRQRWKRQLPVAQHQVCDQLEATTPISLQPS